MLTLEVIPSAEPVVTHVKILIDVWQAAAAWGSEWWRKSNWALALTILNMSLTSAPVLPLTPSPPHFKLNITSLSCWAKRNNYLEYYPAVPSLIRRVCNYCHTNEFSSLQGCCNMSDAVLLISLECIIYPQPQQTGERINTRLSLRSEREREGERKKRRAAQTDIFQKMHIKSLKWQETLRASEMLGDAR